MPEPPSQSLGRSSCFAFVLLAVAACGGRASGPATGNAAGGQTGSVADTGASAGTGAGTATTTGSGTSSGSVAGVSSGSNSGTSASGSTPCGVGASKAPVSFSNQIMPILQRSCSLGGSADFFPVNCHGDPSVTLLNSDPNSPGGGTRQWFGPPPPAVNSAATLTMIYKGL